MLAHYFLLAFIDTLRKYSIRKTKGAHHLTPARKQDLLIRRSLTPRNFENIISLRHLDPVTRVCRAMPFAVSLTRRRS